MTSYSSGFPICNEQIIIIILSNTPSQLLHFFIFNNIWCPRLCADGPKIIITWDVTLQHNGRRIVFCSFCRSVSSSAFSFLGTLGKGLTAPSGDLRETSYSLLFQTLGHHRTFQFGTDIRAFRFCRRRTGPEALAIPTFDFSFFVFSPRDFYYWRRSNKNNERFVQRHYCRYADMHVYAGALTSVSG